MDRDVYLNAEELENMKQTLQFIANENKLTYASQFYLEQSSLQSEQNLNHQKALESLYKKVSFNAHLNQGFWYDTISFYSLIVMED